MSARTVAPAVTFRPIRPGDQEFLLRLYASTRAEEMALVDWSAEEKGAFLRSQFEAQRTYYQQQFPDARFDVVLLSGEPAGRLYVDRRPGEVRLIDIALLPEHRGRGIGGALMREILEQAAEATLPVRIHVERNNPALRLYRRLGFESIEDQGVYHLMEWRPPPA